MNTITDSSSANTLDDLRASMLGCRRCPALVRCRSQVVPGHGDAPGALAFVGLAPGRMGGDRTGIPFSGDRSGSLLRAMIARSGFESTFITNVIRCNPKDRHGRNREPTRREISNCRPFLDAELNLVKPRLIACLGRVAWREMGGAKFDPENPSVVQMNGWSLYPMYHPAYVNRGAYSANKYARDFARLASLLASLV